MSEKIYPVAVIGGGSAGTMAVLRTVLNNDETLFFPGSPKDKKKSRAFWVAKVDNMPGHQKYRKGIEEPNKESLDWLAKSEFSSIFHWHKNRGIKKIEKRIDNIFVLTDNQDFVYLAQYVILCTGVMDVQPHIQGSMDPVFPYANAQSIDYCLRCDGHHTLGKNTAIIGNGDGAAWVAIMLKERYNNPSMAVISHNNEGSFSDDVKALMTKYDIKYLDDEILEINGDRKSGTFSSFTLKNHGDYKCEFAFVSMGMIVYNELALSLNAEVDKRGFITTNPQGMSSVENFYAAGDIRAGFKKQIYTAWDMAVDSADDINRKLRAGRR
ncbi:pyridine nucleotide-disulfide oxidoreductase [Bacteriovorax sp. BSW11_IV]|uniref:NAD(P)/FAD-dependent oxidoreductase n=1 Tax=Bacteriovorax sp. BSW11_IV TaxID=1353529 RepID=UPI00038A0C60|nr:NAD(P)/FAD-dependent oxidoreductase [Bacteriovorax sp. BSW11_IV]EQC48265.1 pyridine nucleotide-disulfide oxidoreductase [Bacteriovorax sp. BSW11_IV]